METRDPLEDELGRYESKWVAISEPDHKVVGSGDQAIDAKKQAEANGYSDAALFKVRPAGKLYVL